MRIYLPHRISRRHGSQERGYFKDLFLKEDANTTILELATSLGVLRDDFDICSASNVLSYGSGLSYDAPVGIWINDSDASRLIQYLTCEGSMELEDDPYGVLREY